MITNPKISDLGLARGKTITQLEGGERMTREPISDETCGGDGDEEYFTGRTQVMCLLFPEIRIVNSQKSSLKEIDHVATELVHWSDGSAFLDIEGTGVQSPHVSKSVEPGGGKDMLGESTYREGKRPYYQTGHGKDGKISFPNRVGNCGTLAT
jgi:hypothetical protein